MNAQDVIAKLKLFPIASLAGFATLVVLIAIYFRGASHAGQQERHEQALTKWKQMEENIQNSVNLETHLEAARTISEDVRKRLIRPSDLAQNYQYFYRLEASNSVKIRALQQQPSSPRPPAAKGKTAAAPAPARLYSRVGYTMNATGGFHQMLAFLEAVERGPHFYHLKEFTLQNSGDREITIAMNFDLLGTP